MIQQANLLLSKLPSKTRKKIKFSTYDIQKFQSENTKFDVIVSCRCFINQTTFSNQVKLFKLLKTLQKQGTCIVMVLHDINLALRFCSHGLLLKEGALVKQGEISEVLTASRLSDTFETELIFSATPTPHFYWA